MLELYNNDCIKIMDELIYRGVKVDLVVTDPPYQMNYKTNYRKNKEHEFCSPIKNDNNEQLIKDFIKKTYLLLNDNKAFYCFCNPNKIDLFKKEIEKNNFKIKNIIVWKKNNWTAGDLKASYAKRYEFIILANKGRSIIKGKRITDIWEFDRVAGKKQIHQNQKPLKLIEQIINKHSEENDLVLDPFMGSGTTGVACKNLNRNFIGIELDNNYFNIASDRINNS
jgi:site-specific DNA-methyltransferase (adenine-specific)